MDAEREMMNLRILTILFSLFFLCSCGNHKQIVPNGKLKKEDKTHCWPNNVTEYLVEDLELGASFSNYPKKNLLQGWAKDKQVTQWKKFDPKTDSSLLLSVNGSFSQCDGKEILPISSKKEFYFAGRYSVMKKPSGENFKSYDRIYILIPDENRLYQIINMNYNWF